MTLAYSGQKRVLAQDMAWIAAAAVLTLLIAASRIELGKIHVSLPSFNDQVGYISVARNFNETGVLQSNLIYPSTLLQEVDKNYFYMPGHYLALAASFRLFGFGVWQSLLPSLLAYVLTSVMVYLIGVRFFGRPVGWLAAVLFLLFPPNVIYAFSAMSEMTRVVVATAGFAAFIYLPLRWQFWLGPWLVAGPFLFRETSALRLLPMALIYFSEQKGLPRWRNTFLFVVYSVVVVGLVFTSELSAGRPTLLPTLIFDNNFATMHSDALAQEAIAHQTVAAWLAAVPVKVWQSSLGMARNLLRNPLSFEVFNFALLMGVGVLAAILGVYKRNVFLLGAAALTVVNFLFLVTFYDRFGYGWLRILLSVTPFLAVVLAAAFECYWWPALQSRFRLGDGVTWRMAPLGLLLVATLAVVSAFFAPAATTTTLDEQRTAWLEGLQHDDSQMLVTPHVFLHYVYKHHPVRWAFVPANGQTLTLLADRYPIGTLLLPKGNRSLRPDELAQVGLIFEQEATFAGETYLVFRKE